MKKTRIFKNCNEHLLIYALVIRALEQFVLITPGVNQEAKLLICSFYFSGFTIDGSTITRKTIFKEIINFSSIELSFYQLHITCIQTFDTVIYCLFFTLHS